MSIDDKRKTQIPASVIDIGNRDMPTMHVPNRDTMYRPDVSSADDGEVDGEHEDEETELDIEKLAVGLMDLTMPISYEYREGPEGGIQFDEKSYASPELKSTVSVPEQNEERLNLKENDEIKDILNNLIEILKKEASSDVINRIVKISNDLYKNHKISEPKDVDLDALYTAWRWEEYSVGDGLWMILAKDMLGSEFVMVDDKTGNKIATIKGEVFFSQDDFGIFPSNVDANKKKHQCAEWNISDNANEMHYYKNNNGKKIPYKVTLEDGDIVSCIPVSFDVTMEQLEEWNDDKDLNRIEPGVEIWLAPKDVQELYSEMLVQRSKESGYRLKCPDGDNDSSDFCDKRSPKYLGTVEYSKDCPNGDTESRILTDYSPFCDPYSSQYIGSQYKKVRVRDGLPPEIPYCDEIEASPLKSDECRKREPWSGWYEFEKKMVQLGHIKPVSGWDLLRSHNTSGVEIYPWEQLFWDPKLLLQQKGIRFCYESLKFDEDKVFSGPDGKEVVIGAGAYSLRKCNPEEGDRRAFHPVQKRLVPFERVIRERGSLSDVSEWTRKLEPNSTFDRCKKESCSSEVGGIISSIHVEPGRDSGEDLEGPVILSIDEKKRYRTDYHRAREAVLRMAASEGIHLLVSPSETLCPWGDRKNGNAWCVSSAVTSMLQTGFKGTDRYSLYYKPENSDLSDYRTGWKIDTSPWLTSESTSSIISDDATDIAMTFDRQPDVRRGAGDWRLISALGQVLDPGSESVNLGEFPYVGNEYSRQVQIIRSVSRDSRLNKEQRLLRTMILLYELALDRGKFNDKFLYYVIPGELGPVGNPLKGGYDQLGNYYDAYSKLSGAGKGGARTESLLSKNRGDNAAVKVEKRLSDPTDDSVEIIVDTGPIYDFYDVEKFYINWRKH